MMTLDEARGWARAMASKWGDNWTVYVDPDGLHHVRGGIVGLRRRPRIGQ